MVETDEQIIKECEANEIVLANRGWSLLQIIKRQKADLAIATEALEFYANFTKEKHQFIFDDETSSRAAVYERYKEHSIGDLGVKAADALYKIKYGTGE